MVSLYALDVPRLPMMHGDPEPTVKEHRVGRDGDDDDEVDDDERHWKKPRRHSAAFEQKVQDPYASDDPGSMLLPVIVAVGAFIPLLFCLCRL